MRPENCVGCCQVLISTLWACTAYQFGVAYVHPMVLSKPESRNTQKLSEHVRDKGSGGRPTSRPNGRFPRTQRSSSKKRTFKAARDVHSTIQLWKHLCCQEHRLCINNIVSRTHMPRKRRRVEDIDLLAAIPHNLYHTKP